MKTSQQDVYRHIQWRYKLLSIFTVVTFVTEAHLGEPYDNPSVASRRLEVGLRFWSDRIISLTTNLVAFVIINHDRNCHYQPWQSNENMSLSIMTEQWEHVTINHDRMCHYHPWQNRSLSTMTEQVTINHDKMCHDHDNQGTLRKPNCWQLVAELLLSEFQREKKHWNLKPKV